MSGCCCFECVHEMDAGVVEYCGRRLLKVLDRQLLIMLFAQENLTEWFLLAAFVSSILSRR